MNSHNSDINNSINDGADFWFNEIGLNVLPANSKVKRPIVPYKEYLDNTILSETFETWKRGDKFNYGFIIILGQIWRGPNEGKYLIGIDIDKELGIKEFCLRNGKTTTLQEFGNKTLVEQHKDDLTKAHIYFISPISFPLKNSDTVVGIEIKKYIVPAPNIHANGHRYEIIGDKKEPIVLTLEQAIQLMRHIDTICVKYGLKYLQNTGSQILTQPLRKMIQTLSIDLEFHRNIQQGQRHITLLSVADSLLIKHRNKNSINDLKSFLIDFNNKICFTPLPENELNTIWKSAVEFVENLKENKPDKISTEKRTIIENATEILMSRNRFLTIEESKQILFYNHNGVYITGGEILIERELESLFGFELRGSDITEIKGHIMRKTYVKREKFDGDLYIINLKNGLYNIRIDKLEPHTPDYYSLNQKMFGFNPGTKPKLFGKFLKDVLYPEDIRTAVEVMAYTFWRYNLFEYYFILVGTGSNGKSVYTGIMTNLHGLKNISNVPLHSLVTNRFALSDLENKDINIDTELSSNTIKDMSILKKLTGKHPIRIERKNQQAYDTILYAKQIFNANQIPANPDNSDAHFRREVILSFPNQFEGSKEDLDLLNKLSTEEELSGIFNVIVNALRRILKTKKIFIRENTIQERRQKYELIYDPISAFHKDAIAEDSIESDYETKDDVYQAYTRFCKYHKLPVEQKETFGKIWKQKYQYRDGRETKGDKRKTIWKGIRLVKWNNNDPLQEILMVSNDI